jgi:putative ABC transport system permease protein
MMEILWQDLRYGLRQLRRSPGFAALAILTLAIGIGANTAIFSFVNAVVLSPLPYPDADRLAIVWSGLGDTNRAPASRFELFQIRQMTKEFDQVGGIWVTNGSLPGVAQAEQVAEQIKIGTVTRNFLPLLCRKPALGRFFSSEDEWPNAPNTIIISHGLWVRRFGSDPGIIGRSVRIRKGSAVVIGVLPENFRLIFPDDASVPANVDAFYTIPIDASDPRGPAFLHLVGRLHTGSNLARAQAEANAIAAQIHIFDGTAGITNFRLSIFPLQIDDFRAVRSTLLLLFGGVAFVLLIGCANLANLLMARARRRHRETITRLALGASTTRLVHQLLTESLLLGFSGALGALALGWATVRGILAIRPPSFTNVGEVHLDGKVLAFTFGVAILTSILFGLAPALSVRRLDLAQNLRQGGRVAGWGRANWAGFFVSAEVALAFVLLVGTGLLMRTFVNVLHVNPGFRAQNVFTFRISGPSYANLHQLQQDLAALPGVQSVAAVSHLPLDDSGNWYDTYWKEGTPPELQSTAMADLRSILPGYFRTIGATLISGRDFIETDDASHEHVAVIDDVLARRLWPHGDALGQKINVSDSPKGAYEFERDWLVVVGIVRHVQYHSLTVMVRPQIYVPFPLAPRPTMVIVIHTAGTVSDLAASARKQVALVNKDLAISRVSPLSDVVDLAVSESRFASLLATLLAATALVLALVGMYGVLSYLVAQRTSEIGIRMAIGADRGHILRMVLIDGLASVATGVAGGLLLSFLLTPLLARLLFGVKPGSLLNYAIILIIVLIVTAFAAFVPARRAMRVDPATSLRYE